MFRNRTRERIFLMQQSNLQFSQNELSRPTAEVVKALLTSHLFVAVFSWFGLKKWGNSSLMSYNSSGKTFFPTIGIFLLGFFTVLIKFLCVQIRRSRLREFQLAQSILRYFFSSMATEQMTFQKWVKLCRNRKYENL